MTEERLQACRKEDSMGLDTSAYTRELLEMIDQLVNIRRNLQVNIAKLRGAMWNIHDILIDVLEAKPRRD